MASLNGRQRKFLRGLAHPLDPVIQIGKAGLTDAVVASIDAALGNHELIKVRFQDFRSEKKELSAEIAERTDADLVGTIGHVAIFFRPARDPDKRTIRLPRSAG